MANANLGFLNQRFLFCRTGDVKPLGFFIYQIIIVMFVYLFFFYFFFFFLRKKFKCFFEILVTATSRNFLADAQIIKKQFNNFKFVMQEKIKSKMIKILYKWLYLLFRMNSSMIWKSGWKMEELLASSADCEREFSLMKALKNKNRNPSEECHFL